MAQWELGSSHWRSTCHHWRHQNSFDPERLTPSVTYSSRLEQVSNNREFKCILIQFSAFIINTMMILIIDESSSSNNFRVTSFLPDTFEVDDQKNDDDNLFISRTTFAQLAATSPPQCCSLQYESARCSVYLKWRFYFEHEHNCRDFQLRRKKIKIRIEIDSKIELSSILASKYGRGHAMVLINQSRTLLTIQMVPSPVVRSTNRPIRQRTSKTDLPLPPCHAKQLQHTMQLQISLDLYRMKPEEIKNEKKSAFWSRESYSVNSHYP